MAVGVLGLTSGSGHGVSRLLLAVEGALAFPPSCFLFLLRSGFSASWFSVETKSLEDEVGASDGGLEAQCPPSTWTNHVVYRGGEL